MAVSSGGCNRGGSDIGFGSEGGAGYGIGGDPDQLDALISQALRKAVTELHRSPVTDVVRADGCWCRRLQNGQLEPLLPQPASPPANQRTDRGD